MMSRVYHVQARENLSPDETSKGRYDEQVRKLILLLKDTIKRQQMSRMTTHLGRS